MRSIHTTTFLVFLIPWIMIYVVLATESENKQLPTNDSKQLPGVSKKTNADRKPLSDGLNGTNADIQQLLSILNRTNARSEQQPLPKIVSNTDSNLLSLFRNETKAGNKQLWRVLGEIKSDSNQVPPDGTHGTNGTNDVSLSSVLNKTIADTEQLPPLINGTNSDIKQLNNVKNESNDASGQPPSVLNKTNAERKQLSRDVNGTNADSKKMPRVLGGSSADRIDFAYVTQVFNHMALCGGTIVTARSILTASHCFMRNADPQFIIIAVGNTGKTVLDPQTRKLPVWDLALHDEFDQNGYLVNDIALLFLDRPITLGYAVRRALLVDTDEFLNETGLEFLFAGWGTTTYPPQKMSQFGLQQICFELVPQKKCEELHNSTIINEIFCLYKDEGEDTCSGDSGGGVKWNGMIAGIVSCGDGCGAADLPGLYTNVYEYLDWIEERLQETSTRMCAHEKAVGGLN